jgi:flagellar M-ring protein FliF
MDSSNRIQEKAKEWISDRRNKAMLVGIIVLATIAILQVANLESQRIKSPLFADCQLRALDLQRMQIALSKAGLKDYEVSSHQLLVPQEHVAQYLQAISDHDAVPSELQEKSASSIGTNPFLSITQQVSIQRESRNQKLRDMLMLLPFVEQAWFEMDESGLRYGVPSIEKRAAVTIRPKLRQPLLEQQVYTISQLVCGAIHGLDKEQLVIVDLTTGFAHQGVMACADFEQKLAAQRILYNRKQQLESQLRESLSCYVGLGISVLVEADSVEIEDPTARAFLPREIDSASQSETAQADLDENLIEEEPVLHGANGQVALDDIAPDSDPPILPYSENVAIASPALIDNPEAASEVRLVSHATPANIVLIPTTERVSVVVDIPERLLLERYRSNNPFSGIESSPTERTRTLQSFLDRFKPELDQIIRAVLGVQGLQDVPVVYNLIANDVPETATGWPAMANTLWADNWPSVAVLFTGLLLISVISSGGKSGIRESTRPAEPAEVSLSKIRTTGPNAMEANECAIAKVQLSQMIEKDPDAAARVIENWIRDAA